MFESHRGRIDPSTASDATLREYGLPPRPDKLAAPSLYRTWVRLVACDIVETAVSVSGVRHRPNLAPAAERNAVPSTSPNWSGVVVTDNDNNFSTRDSQIMGEMTLSRPVWSEGAFPPGGARYMSAWVGIDGAGGSNAVAQCGVNVGVDVAGNLFNAAWIEWYPDPERQVALPMTWGDIIGFYMLVLSKTEVQMIVTNYSTGIRTPVFHYTAPGATALQGNCAEWIVERPEVGNGLSALAPYFGATMKGCLFTFGVGVPPMNTHPPYAGPGFPKNGASTIVTMNDEQGALISHCATVVPTALNPDPNYMQYGSIGFTETVFQR